MGQFNKIVLITNKKANIQILCDKRRINFFTAKAPSDKKPNYYFIYMNRVTTFKLANKIVLSKKKIVIPPPSKIEKKTKIDILAKNVKKYNWSKWTNLLRSEFLSQFG
ncbi:hypothetical protein BpHYR1_041740 [Brachionus plicatilis]|uniref:Uncharacterized protein n=1 Tax=Brachionus plicatilis TaxID=10195 RepID=A0A3M7SFM9_BRAPC|nr:hypothetical protein BpHYR1_041740 [Brachionus plicatilis]